MKSILILSGGLDSSVLLAKLVSRGDEVRALSINYGQRHVRELEAAAAVAAHYRVEHKVINLTCLRPLLAGSSQTDNLVPVPNGHYAAENMKVTVVPNRNMILLAVAGAWAISTKSAYVAYAAHAGDHAIYPDCREEFCRPLGEALSNADWHQVGLYRPFLDLTKSQIVLEGHELAAPMHLTYSCYRGWPAHCGLCGTCQERKEAFQLANVPDPTNYES